MSQSDTARSRRSASESNRLLGEFELLVMLAVLRLDGRGYARTVREEIESRTGQRVSKGAAYVTLDRLVDKGYLTSWLGEPTAKRGGRAKRFFQVLPAGLEAVRTSHRALSSMVDGLEAHLETP